MRCTGYEMVKYKGTQASHLYKKLMHTLLYNQWATIPGRSLNHSRPKSITHLCTFSDNGVYVALQLFLVILVFDQWHIWTMGINTLLLSTGVLGYFYMLRDDSPDIHGTSGFMWYPSHERQTPMLKARFFTPFKFGTTARNRTPDLLTTMITCYSIDTSA